MKTLLSFVFLLPLFSLAQPLGNAGVTGGADLLSRPTGVSILFQQLVYTNTTAAQTSYLTSNTVVHANCLVVAVVQDSISSETSAEIPSGVSGIGLSWTALTTTNISGSTSGGYGQRVTVYTSMTNANTPSGAITVSFANAPTGASVYVCEFTNVATSSTILQSAKGSNTTANATITLSALTGTKNAVVVAFADRASAGNFATAADAGYVEDYDAGYSTPSSSLTVLHAIGTTDNTPAITSSGAWCGIAFEIAVLP